MEKERRNFLLLSVLIILNRYAKVNFKEIKIFDNTIYIDDPSVLGFMLIIVWGYFGLRFFQECLSDKESLNNLKSTFSKKMLSYAMKRIKPYVKKKYDNNESEWKVTEDFQNEKIKELGFTSFKLVLSKQGGAGDIIESEPYEVPIIYLLIPFVRSSLFVAFTSKNFSTYIFPFLIALFALILLFI